MAKEGLCDFSRSVFDPKPLEDFLCAAGGDDVAVHPTPASTEELCRAALDREQRNLRADIPNLDGFVVRRGREKDVGVRLPCHRADQAFVRFARRLNHLSFRTWVGKSDVEIAVTGKDKPRTDTVVDAGDTFAKGLDGGRSRSKK